MLQSACNQLNILSMNREISHRYPKTVTVNDKEIFLTCALAKQRDIPNICPDHIYVTDREIPNTCPDKASDIPNP